MEALALPSGQGLPASLSLAFVFEVELFTNQADEASGAKGISTQPDSVSAALCLEETEA